MPVCKTCDKTFHACSNCGLFYDWEYRYCSKNCWRESRPHLEMLLKFSEFYSTLSSYQTEVFRELWGLDDEYYDEATMWMDRIDSVRKQIKEGKWDVDTVS